MQTLCIFACLWCAITADYLAEFACANPTGCVVMGSKMPLMCNATAMRCYVHTSVCNSLTSIILFVNENPGFDIYISTTQFQCTLNNIPDCSNETRIRQPPALESSPQFCAFTGLTLTQPNTLITTVGPTSAIIYNVPVSDNSSTATVLSVGAPNITINNIQFWASRSAIQTAAITASNANSLTVTNCKFSFTTMAIVVTSALQTCANITISGASYSYPRTITTYPILLMAAPCTGSVTITNTPTSQLLLADPVATQTSYPNIIDFSSIYAASIPRPPPPPPPPVPECVESGLSKKTRMAITIIGSVALFLGVVALAEYCRYHSPHKALLLQQQLDRVQTRLDLKRSD